MRRDLKLLDCTLRDGGYINNWEWGYREARDIINLLVKANIDIVEVGFLRNVDSYNKDVTVCNRIEELKELLPNNRKNTQFSAMAMRSNYDIKKLADCEKTGIDIIRITAHDYDIKEGMEFAKAVKDKGYKLSINPINIMGYSDNDILWILDSVNKIQPYQFSIVDTFGSMKQKDLDRIVSIADHNLSSNIRLGLHLHENMALSFSLAQSFILKQIKRDITIDASLLGMGRVPGNLPIELIADYLNDSMGKEYDIDYLMDAIQDYIQPIKEEQSWGYSPAYFLSAKYNLHRNYAEHFLNKGDLTNRDINYLLSKIDRKKTTVFDSKYADYLYHNYLINNIDDTEDKNKLYKEIHSREILIIAPGKSISNEYQNINQYIKENIPVVIAVNFIPEEIKIDYVFFGNNKRLDKLENCSCKVIATSNLKSEQIDYRINYNNISRSLKKGQNSMILLLKLLEELDIVNVKLAGADGYSTNCENYYDSSIRTVINNDENFNKMIGKILKELKLNISFLTKSQYEKYAKYDEE